jgi:hypothetical protein
MELGIRLSFVKTSEFRGGLNPPKPPASVRHCLAYRLKIPLGKNRALLYKSAFSKWSLPFRFSHKMFKACVPSSMSTTFALQPKPLKFGGPDIIWKFEL